MTSLKRLRSVLLLQLLVLSTVAEIQGDSSATSDERAESAAKHMQPGIRYSPNTDSGTKHRRSISTKDVYGNLINTDDFVDSAEKRKWEKNTVRVWGKRQHVDNSVSDMADYVGENLAKTKDRENWENNRAYPEINYGRWVVQNGDNVEHDAELHKRKWSNNKVRVWGKRSTKVVHPLGQSHWIRSVNSTLKPANAFAAHHAITSENHQGAESRVARSAVWDDEEILRKNVENWKNAIEENGLNWVSVDDSLEPAFSMGSSPSDQEHRLTTKRAASFRYGSGRVNKAGHYPFYSADGPKRSWRTNVIRVWGK